MRVLKHYSRSGALHFLWVDWRHLYEMPQVGRQLFIELIDLYTWVDTSGGMISLYQSHHKLVCVFKQGKQPHINNVQLGKYGCYRPNVRQAPGMNSFQTGHDD